MAGGRWRVGCTVAVGICAASYDAAVVILCRRARTCHWAVSAVGVD